MIFSEAGSGHPEAGALLYGVLGEAARGVTPCVVCGGFNPRPEGASGVPHAVGEGYG